MDITVILFLYGAMSRHERFGIIRPDGTPRAPSHPSLSPLHLSRTPRRNKCSRVHYVYDDQILGTNQKPVEEVVLLTTTTRTEVDKFSPKVDPC